MDIVSTSYLPGDQRLIDLIVYELKSQGIFDQFRRECIADVDTKPAYQNLSQRLEGSVMNFLNKQKFSEDVNKNQLREQLRKSINESGFLDSGVERIVDQVVNPKISSVFLPKVVNVVYRYLGIQKPNESEMKDIADDVKEKENKALDTLLPKDLEAVSPESSFDHSFNSTIDKKEAVDTSMNGINKDETVEEEESPPFEPLDEDLKLFANVCSDTPKQTTTNIEVFESARPENQDVCDSSQDISQASMNSEDSKNPTNLEAVEQTKEDSEDSKMDISDLDDLSRDTLPRKEPIESTTEAEPVKKVDDKKSQDKHRSTKTDKDKRSHSKSESKSKDHRERSSSKHSSKDKDKKDSHENSDKPSSKSKDNKEKSDKKISKCKSESDKSKDKDKSYKDKDKQKSSKDKDRSKPDKDKHERDKSSFSKHSSSHSRDKSSSSKKDDSSRSSSSNRDKSSSKTKDSSTKDRESKSKDKDRSKSSSSKDKDRKTSGDSISKHSDKRSRNNDKDKSSSSSKKYKKPEDDHYSHKDKKRERRSTDRDSNDGASKPRRNDQLDRTNHSKNGSKETDEGFSGGGDSTSNSDNVEQVMTENVVVSKAVVGVDDTKSEASQSPIKYVKPKFASNIHEAMRIMKIRRQLAKLEKQNQLALANLPIETNSDVQQAMKKDKPKKRKHSPKSKQEDVAVEEPKQVLSNHSIVKELHVQLERLIANTEEEKEVDSPVLKTQSLSLENFAALEARLAQEMAKINPDAYEDDDDYEYSAINFSPKKICLENSIEPGKDIQISLENEDNGKGAMAVEPQESQDIVCASSIGPVKEPQEKVTPDKLVDEPQEKQDSVPVQTEPDKPIVDEAQEKRDSTSAPTKPDKLKLNEPQENQVIIDDESQEKLDSISVELISDKPVNDPEEKQDSISVQAVYEPQENQDMISEDSYCPDELIDGESQEKQDSEPKEKRDSTSEQTKPDKLKLEEPIYKDSNSPDKKIEENQGSISSQTSLNEPKVHELQGNQDRLSAVPNCSDEPQQNQDSSCDNLDELIVEETQPEDVFKGFAEASHPTLPRLSSLIQGLSKHLSKFDKVASPKVKSYRQNHDYGPGSPMKADTAPSNDFLRKTRRSVTRFEKKFPPNEMKVAKNSKQDDEACRYLEPAGKVHERHLEILNKAISDLEKSIETVSLNIQNNIPSSAKKGRKRKVSSAIGTAVSGVADKKSRIQPSVNSVDHNDISAHRLTSSSSPERNTSEEDKTVSLKNKQRTVKESNKRYSSADLYKPRVSTTSSRRRAGRLNNNN